MTNPPAEGRSFYVYGTGGIGVVLAEVLFAMGYSLIGAFDDREGKKSFYGVEVSSGLERAGEDLEASADLRHFDLAALRVGATGHQLDVVHHDQIDPAFDVADPLGLAGDAVERLAGARAEPKSSSSGEPSLRT